MQSFLTACGLTEPLQLVVERPGMEGGELRLMHQPFAIIGRDSRADLVLDHAQVSRRHLYFQVIEGRAFWVDMESRTGTRFDGAIRKHGWLIQSGGALSIGPYVIRGIVDANCARSALSAAESLPVAPFVATGYSNAWLPEVALEFLNGPSRATSWPVRRVMSFIGSAIGCKFRLTDASVSRFHASFLRTSGGLWIVDLLGQGGITVNEVPVRFSHLTDGDLLAIGRYQIRVRCRPGREGTTIDLPDRVRGKDVTEPRPREHVFSRARRPKIRRQPQYHSCLEAIWRTALTIDYQFQLFRLRRGLRLWFRRGPFLRLNHLRRVYRIDASAVNQSIWGHAAADVRSISTGNGNDASNVRDHAP